MERPALSQPELLPLPEGVASERVIARRYRPGDGTAFFAGLAPHRDELMRWMMWPQRHQEVAVSESYAMRMHAKFALRESMPMGLWNPAGEFLGGSGFHAPDWNTPKTEIGFFLLPPARGQGLAADVVRLLVHYAFDHMGMNRVFATCDADNAASAGVLRRAGVPEEGRMRAENRDHHGQLRDTLIFGIALDDYPVWRERHGVATLRYL
ncbi:MAG: GNAT family N-acetyltransferase [Burkholderiaceae bacterium]